MAGPVQLDRLERVTDLVLVLLNTDQPLSLDSIALQVPGYPVEHAARRQAFERDKRLLRNEGIPVRTLRLPGGEQYGYSIDREAFYLPDLELAPDEQVALHLAVAGVHLDDPSGRDALLKLGATGLGEVRPIATLDTPRALVDLFEAVRTKAVASFSYRQTARRVVPAGLWFRFGHWYLVAWDLDREAVRTFRVDRIADAVGLESPGGAVLPEGIDIRASLPDEPWRAEGEDYVVTRIRVDAMEGPRIAEEVGKRQGREPGGRRVGRPVPAGGRIPGPPLLDPRPARPCRDSRAARVPGGAGGVVVGHGDGSGSHGAGRTVAELSASDPASARHEAVRPVPGRETSQRLRRLLAVVGWLAQVGEAPIADVARRFTIDEEELIRELELAACCGVPPYTPDTLMEIEVSETSVRAFLPPEFARPRRLTPAEGFAVAASARLIMAVPGPDDGALRRALSKLDAALGSREAIGIDVDAPHSLDAIRQACEAGGAVEIDYHSGSRDESTTRVVEPVQVITTDGHWYLDAFCRRAGDMRRFRVDRIGAVRPLGEAAVSTPRPLRAAEDAFVPGPGAVEVQLHLGDGAQWVPESVPVRAVAYSAAGAVTDVVLDVAGMAWFERLLLQLGPGAYVVRPPELTDLAARAAARVLRNYQKDTE